MKTGGVRDKERGEKEKEREGGAKKRKKIR